MRISDWSSTCALPIWHLLTAALALTAFWALCTAVGGNADILPGMAEGLRNFAWLSFMFVILHRGERRTNEHPAAVTAIYTVLGIVLMLQRSEEHTSELQSLMRISYAVFCLTKKN